MDNEINTAKVVKSNFEKGYVMLPVKYQKHVRRELMQECEWSAPQTFYSKVKGETSVRKTEIPVIERIFAEYNLNPWTGKYLS